MIDRMSKIFLVLILLPLLVMTACGPISNREPGLSREEVLGLDAKYNFSLASLKGEPRLKVELSLTMPRDQLGLRIPNQFLRKNRLFERLENLAVVDGNARIERLEEGSKAILVGAKGERVRIQYFARSYGTYPKEVESFSAPIIRDNYFQFAGSMLLVFPLAFFQTKQIPMEITWDLPEGQDVFNSFASLEKHQKIMVSGTSLLDAFFLGGEGIRMYKKNVREKPVYVVISGDFDQIEDEDFVSLATRLIEKQRETWRDDNYPYFLVSLLSLGDGCTNNREVKFGGTAHFNSFRSYYPKDCPMKAEMAQLISHELMHMWIGKKVRVGNMQGGYDGKWFTEGFTDYFGRVLAYRAGILGEREYFLTLNSSLEKYFTTNERLVSLKNLVKRLYRKGYSNRELESVPYQQGEIMAIRLNEKIKKSSNGNYSLDDVLRDLLSQANDAGGSKVFSVEELEEVVDRYVVGVFKTELAKIESGAELIPPKLSQCSRPTVSRYTSYLGGRSRYFPDGRIFTYRRYSSQCFRWLN